MLCVKFRHNFLPPVYLEKTIYEELFQNVVREIPAQLSTTAT